MQRVPVGIVGASGYSGIEASRLLVRHPGVELRFATSDRWVGELLRDRVPDLPKAPNAIAGLRYRSNAEGEAQASDCAVVLLATPAETSLALAPRLLAKGVRVIDLSGAFRLRDSALYPHHYGFPHSAPELLREAVYGLPELSREGLAGARLVANPGCYATAVAVALAPLLKGALLSPEGMVADAASGVTGAGRKASEEYSFTEIADDFRAYRTLKHQHLPEIRQALAGLEAPSRPRALTFTPHLLPLRRGILATCYARLRTGVEAAQVAEALSAFVGAEPFLRTVASPDRVSLRAVVGTNDVVLGAAVDREGDDAGRVVVISALDNLLKGAAGQAVQNLNLMLGLEERSGLEALRGFAP